MAIDAIPGRVPATDLAVRDGQVTQPLSSTGSDGKATRWRVADETGTALLEVDAAAGTVALSGGLRLAKVSETFDYDSSSVVDSGTTGTYTFTSEIPAGAIVLATKIVVGAGFAGDTSAVVTVGDGTDVDRYMTGTPDVFTTAASGVECGVPSGDKLVTTANAPVVIVTTAADYTSVSAGSMTVTVYYITE